MSAFYNEIDPYAAQWLRNLIAAGHIAPGDVDERSIVDVQPADLAGYDQCHFFAGIGGWSHALRLAGWADDRPVWTGSCPCQPFSAAGKRKGVDDARHLWPEFRRLIAECSPPVVFGEQVASADGRTWLAGVRADLEALVYAVGAADLCAASVGAPHIRQRLWWVADANQGQRGRLADGEGRLGDGAATGRVEGDGLAQSGGATRRRADADGGLAGDGGLQPGWQHGQQPQDGRAGGMGDADDAGLPQRPEPEGRSAVGHEGPAADAPGPLGFWSAFDLLPCTDGKARRVEPGTFPLAHGSTFKLGSGSAFEGKSRVGMLRAYGNAIVPPVAAEFIAAFMECRP